MRCGQHVGVSTETAHFVGVPASRFSTKNFDYCCCCGHRNIDRLRFCSLQESIPMDNKFGALFLQQAETAIKQIPGCEALLNLLRLVQPEFTFDDMDDKAKRDSAVRQLKCLVHPDRHPTSNKSATKLFQTVEIFYKECCRNLGQLPKKRKTVLSTMVTPTTPLTFHIKDKWPFATSDRPMLSPTEPFEEILKGVALQCINCRGNIAHGKQTELLYDMTCQSVQVTEDQSEKIFLHPFGGTKVLETVEEIKQEIFDNGPVVSISFSPNKHHSFVVSPWAKAEGATYPVLIVGWEVSAIGETWIIKTADTSKFEKEERISIGHFEIDERCIAPKSNLSHINWQDSTISIVLSSVKGSNWYEWTQLETFLSSIELETLGKSMGGQALMKTPFLVIECDVWARSRWGTLRDIAWAEWQGKWRAQIDLGK